MQQTEKYKLNLIEPDDPFLPDGLNQSAQKIENVLAGEAAARAAGDAALDQRVTVLEGHRMAYGTYTGNGAASQFIPLPFTPTALFIQTIAYAQKAEMVVGAVPGIQAQLAEGGFNALLNYTTAGAVQAVNTKGTKYIFLAFC